MIIKTVALLHTSRCQGQIHEFICPQMVMEYLHVCSCYMRTAPAVESHRD